jgi:endonuclease/exonuclease/phosphatase family metal-dependent hydrolase
MLVATLNLWGTSGDWPARRRVLADGFKALQPDLVAFQEAVRTDDYDQAADLLGDGYQFVQQTEREDDGRGIVIASRWPLGWTREIDLHLTPRTEGFACGTLIAEVLAPEPVGPLLLANHLPSWQPRFERERELQAVAAARAIEELAGGPDAHRVVVGDFDADPASASIRFWTGRQSLDDLSVCYRDAWELRHPGEPGQTFTPANPLVPVSDWPFQRIDYVLVGCSDHGGPTLDIAGCERVFDQPVDGVYGSDHFGLVADLRPPG